MNNECVITEYFPFLKRYIQNHISFFNSGSDKDNILVPSMSLIGTLYSTHGLDLSHHLSASLLSFSPPALPQKDWINWSDWNGWLSYVRHRKDSTHLPRTLSPRLLTGRLVFQFVSAPASHQTHINNGLRPYITGRFQNPTLKEDYSSPCLNIILACTFTGAVYQLVT